MQQLTDLGLIDEYQLLVHPIILGAGKSLFTVHFTVFSQSVEILIIKEPDHPDAAPLSSRAMALIW